MTHKLRSELSSQTIYTSADIIFGSRTFLEGFVILDLKITSHRLVKNKMNTAKSV